jgi:hypothetical protein
MGHGKKSKQFFPRTAPLRRHLHGLTGRDEESLYGIDFIMSRFHGAQLRMIKIAIVQLLCGLVEAIGWFSRIRQPCSFGAAQAVGSIRVTACAIAERDTQVSMRALGRIHDGDGG